MDWNLAVMTAKKILKDSVLDVHLALLRRRGLKFLSTLVSHLYSAPERVSQLACLYL